MNTHTRFTRLCTAVLAAGMAAGLLACGGGSSYGGASTQGNPPPASRSTYSVASLVADATTTGGYGEQGMRQIDPNLVNPWGLAFNPTGFAWVANNGTSSSTLYDGNGVPQSLVVTLPTDTHGDASPTGIVYNPGQGFQLTQAGLSGPGVFLFAGEGGTISGWSPLVDRDHAVLAVDASAANAIYKGLALASFGDANYLYAADFHNNRIDVYDANFNVATLPGSFSDPSLPAGYAPFGIEAIGNLIYVSYAQQDADARDEVAASGLGYVDVYDSGGKLIRQLVAGGALNAPWGMAMAPAGFGSFSGDLLVANFGDGRINAYDPNSGDFVGTLNTPDGLPIVIDGLWAIAFGNGFHDQPLTTLYFTAGPDDEQHGVYGRIDAR